MTLPLEVQAVISTLQSAGFEAFAVGGCVRDLLLGREPTDWDVTTNAPPAEIQKLFPKHFYANQFGTVTVLTGGGTPSGSPFKGGETTADSSPDKGVRQLAEGGVRQVEVTPYRVEANYSDQRHPDMVKFTASLTEDLARRDFTINAMAMAPSLIREGRGGLEPPAPPTPSGSPLSGGGKRDAVVIDDMYIIDPFGGLKDLDAKLIRAVGAASERFAEDALRLLRAVRFAAQLDFKIEGETDVIPAPGSRVKPGMTTFAALKAQAPAISAVSHERVRDELVKLVMSAQPERGFALLQETGLLALLLPEVAEGVGIEQNKHHIYTVFEHNIKSLQWAAHYGYPLHVRLAALLHDIGKPKTRRRQANDYTFYGHEIVGARMAERLLRRLKFSNDVVEQVTHLIRHHMFYYDIGKVTEAGARRLLRRVGREHFDDLIKVRIAERKGSGVPKAEPYRLRHLQFLVEKAAQKPITTSELRISGNDLIKELGLRPGPVIGGILNALLAEVLDDPAKNTREQLLARARELKARDPQELKALGEAAKDEAERAREEEIKRKYRV